MICLPLFGAEFRVSTGGAEKDRLMAVFEKVRSLELTKNRPARRLSGIEVLQKINNKTFLVYTRKEVVTGSVVSGGKVVYLTKWETDHDQIYCYKPCAALNVVDDEKIGSLDLEVTDESYAYTTSSGAKKTVRILTDRKQEEGGEELFSKEEFVARLKGGETWTLKNYSEKNCHSCLGDGVLSGSEKNASCPACKGNGVLAEDLLVKW
jgi:hypothetical protein